MKENGKQRKSVEGKLKDIANEKFPEMSWVFDDWKSIDRKLSKLPLPAIVCVMPVSGTLTFKNGRVKDKPNCYLVFLDKVQKDADGDDNEEVYTRMKDEAVRFVKELNKSGQFEQIDGEIPYDVISEGMSDVLTGVGIPLSIKELMGVCI